jgi:ricin-type beta-trefoil lectin protein
MLSVKKSRRLLFFAVACAVMAASGVAASLAASADEIATPSSTIVAEHSDKCLTAANSKLVQRRCSAADAVRQTFRITPADGGYLIGLLAGGCLGLPADARPQVMAACDDADDLTFALLTAEDGSAYAIQGGSGLCLDVAGDSTADGAAVTAAACGESEKWQVTPSASASPSPTRTRKRTPSASPSATPSPAPSATPSATASAPASATPTASPAAEACARETAATPQTRVTEVNVGVPVTGYGQEGDTEPLPTAIAAAPDGGSWLAWRGTDSKVYLGRLDCDDKLVGTPTSFAGIDLQDVQADATGGVLLLTRSGNCHTGPLCGGESSPCNTMHMIRFDTEGKLVWERQVTNLSDSVGGYDNGARFVWWYQHHGRLASDGSNYAAYFGVAITVQNGSCVDIHEGDRMQVVNAQGNLVSGHDSFEVGCSHAWTSRIVWDPRTSHFVMVCATDNNCRIAQPNPYRTVAAGTCDGTLFGGDLVLAGTQGYWTAWSQGGQARLEHFTTGASDKTVTTGAATSHPHLVSYGSANMLLAWESGSSMQARVFDAGTGAAVGDAFSVAVRDHAYQAFKAYPDGSAAYPAAGSTATAIKIARVMPLA